MRNVSIPIILLLVLVNRVDAGFVISIDLADLTHDGSATHEVDFLIEHDGTATADTLSGIDFTITNAANASVQQLAVMTDFTGLALSSEVNASNEYGLNVFPDFAVDPDPGVLLGKFVFDVSGSNEFTIGLSNFQATRGFGTVGTSEFSLDPASFSGDVASGFSFTVSNASAVPEPSSVGLLAVFCTGALSCRLRLRRRR